MTTTLYVAGPMTGLPEFNHPAFNAAARLLEGRGYSVLNPVNLDPETGVHQAWDWYIRRSLRMLLDADAVATLPDWFTSRGATIEVHVAAFLKMPVRPLSDWCRG